MKKQVRTCFLFKWHYLILQKLFKNSEIMKTITKLFMMAAIMLVASSCSKDEKLIEEQVQPIDYAVTINKMVAITN